MHRLRVYFLQLLLLVSLPVTSAFTNAVPPLAIALLEGRNYDQSHDSGYIDWSGPVQYVYMTHRDNSSLPATEGGTFCGSGCQEWVTRIGNGGVVSGSLVRDVSYFEVMVGFTHDSNVGSATLRACSAVSTTNLYLGPGGGLPGFVTMALTVPVGCRSWSLSASSGYVDFRSVDANYVIAPPTPTHTSTLLPTSTPSATQTQTLIPTSTFTPTVTGTASQTPTQTATSTATPSATWTASPTFTLTDTPPATTTPSHTPTYIATMPSSPPKVFIAERWWVWDNGDLKIAPGHLPIANVKITISDPQDRWPTVILEFDPDKVPDFISWDRRFADGTLAPSGEYIVLAVACDVNNLCGRDRGVVVIPYVVNSTATIMSTATATKTETPVVTQVAAQRLPKLTQIPTMTSPEFAVESAPTEKPHPLWQLLGLLGLFVVIASASVVDPRPVALDRLREVIRLITDQADDGPFENIPDNKRKE